MPECTERSRGSADGLMMISVPTRNLQRQSPSLTMRRFALRSDLVSMRCFATPYLLSLGGLWKCSGGSPRAAAGLAAFAGPLSPNPTCGYLAPVGAENAIHVCELDFDATV
jgi:hypothetical protein